MLEKTRTISVPVGLEQLLFTAASDPEFRAELIRDRVAAAERRGLDLTPSERSVLAIAPDDQLEAMIDRIDTSERSLKRHKFMRAVAATAVTLAAGTGLAAGGCSGDKQEPQTDAPFKGQVDTAQVDTPQADTAKIEIEQPEPAPTRGIRPEVDLEDPALNNLGGARPEVEVQEPEMNLDGGARPDFDEQPVKPKRPKVKIKKELGSSGGITVGGPEGIDDIDL
jgi:hypothetical protein